MFPFQLPKQFAVSRERGVVFTELALILPLLVLLLVGVYDLSMLLRERVVLTEALRSALRSIVVAQPFEPNRYTGTPEERERQYATERYQRAIAVARHTIERNGLQSSSYYFNLFDAVRTDTASGTTFEVARFTISRQPDTGFLVLRYGKLTPVCINGSTFVHGVFVGPGFMVADPSINNDCST